MSRRKGGQIGPSAGTGPPDSTETRDGRGVSGQDSHMPMCPFYERFPDVAARETRTLLIRGGSPVPDGNYGLVEFYCDEPGCDCRRVVIQVWEERRPGVALATLNYGWESADYYAKWSGDRELAAEMAMATLELFGPQSKYADYFLDLFVEVIWDADYVARLRRHYRDFRKILAGGRRRPEGGIPGLAATLNAPGSQKSAPQSEPPPLRGAGRTGAREVIHRLRIALKSVNPPVWRRVEVRGDITLARLHDVVQIVMGWTDTHLHCFRAGDDGYSIPLPGTDWEDSGDIDSRRVRLDQVVANSGDMIRYEYDFGDGWDHEILVESITQPVEGVAYPRCLAGESACPPEDCGGPWGYADLLEALGDPKHEAHQSSKTWIGGTWDANTFYLKNVNLGLRKSFRPARARRRSDDRAG